MMNVWELPVTIDVAGRKLDIRTDYRIVLDCLVAMNNPDLDDEEKWLYVMMSMIVDFDNLQEAEYAEACEKLSQFIDQDTHQDTDIGQSKRIMDWEQDAALIIPAVNHVAGKEIRAESYMHWWTFIAYYMSIGESVYSQVISIRQKKMSHQKLDKWEQKYYLENKSLIDLKDRLSKEELEEERRVSEKFG